MAPPEMDMLCTRSAKFSELMQNQGLKCWRMWSPENDQGSGRGPCLLVHVGTAQAHHMTIHIFPNVRGYP